jgi:two-component system, chemotaxis family, sensor kinase CheA
VSAVADDICADFLVEVDEILEALGPQLLALERDAGDRDGLNAVFRAFHTIKGGAGFLGFEPMVALCHAVEDRLNGARDGSARLDAAALDPIQQAVDLLVDMVRAVASGTGPLPAPPSLLDALAAHASAGAVAAPPAHPGAIAPDTHGDGDSLDDLDFEALLDSLHGTGAAPGTAPPPPAPPPVPSPAPVATTAARAAPEPADATVRVDVRRLDAMVDLVGELVLARNRLKTLRPRLRDDDLDRAVASLDVATSRLQSAVMTARMQPVGRVFARFPKLARDVARQLGKQVQLDIAGADTELDRNLVEALADPLVHLVRNAIDHGIEAPAARFAAGKPEAGQVTLSARQEGDHVAIEVRDDGGGIDPEAIRRSALAKGLVAADAAARLSPEECLQLLFLPGFSTREEVTDLSGRGVGMDVVQSRIRELSGSVHIQSVVGTGSRFLIRVPLTLAILPTLLVELGDDVYALPLVRVVEVLAHDPARILWIDGRRALDLRQQPLPLLDLRDWLGLPAGDDTGATCVVLQSGDHRHGLVVDRVRGREEVVIKALPPTLRGLPGYAGASLVGDGRMALILDVDALLEPGAHSSRPAGSR